jgi:hypothetical protein
MKQITRSLAVLTAAPVVTADQDAHAGVWYSNGSIAVSKLSPPPTPRCPDYSAL